MSGPDFKTDLRPYALVKRAVDDLFAGHPMPAPEFAELMKNCLRVGVEVGEETSRRKLYLGVMLGFWGGETLHAVIRIFQ